MGGVWGGGRGGEAAVGGAVGGGEWRARKLWRKPERAMDCESVSAERERARVRAQSAGPRAFACLRTTSERIARRARMAVRERGGGM